MEYAVTSNSNWRLLESERYIRYNGFIPKKEDKRMNTKDILKDIRVKNNLTQDEMAEKLYITRQAVSRWENGDSGV